MVFYASEKETPRSRLDYPIDNRFARKNHKNKKGRKNYNKLNKKPRTTSKLIQKYRISTKNTTKRRVTHRRRRREEDRLEVEKVPLY
jgi:hypothetical protein